MTAELGHITSSGFLCEVSVENRSSVTMHILTIHPTDRGFTDEATVYIMEKSLEKSLCYNITRGL